MNFRTTLLLAVLVLAALVVILVLQWNGEPKPEEPTLTTKQVYPALNVGDITRIEIVRTESGERIVLEKSDDKWHILEPVEARADWHQAGALATLLANLSYSREIALTDAGAAEFGLAPPVATVSFTANGETRRLEVGQQGGIGNDRFTYLRLPGDDSARLVDASLNSMVTEKLSEFRDKSLVEFGAFDVAAISLTRAGQTIRAERTGGGWVLTEPVRTRADTDAVGSVVSTAAGLKADSFAAESRAEDDRYGFAEPRLVIRLEKKLDKPSPVKKETLQPESEAAETAKKEEEETSPAPKPEVVTITLGGFEDLQKTRVYARVEGQAAVVTLDEKKVRDLEKDLFALRDKRAVPLDSAKTTYVALDIGGAAVAAENLGNVEWRIAAPEKAPADKAEVESLLDRLAELKVKEFRDGVDPADAALGLDKPYGTVTFRQVGDAKDTTVIIGKAPDSEQAWALERGTESAGRVDQAAVDKLKTTWLDLHSRNVWRIEEHRKISSVSWTSGGEMVTVERSQSEGKDVFRMTSPVSEELDAEKAAKLFDRLETLDAEEFLGCASQAAEYGLDSPSMEITVIVSPAPGEEAGTANRLRVAETDGKYAAMLEGGALVFTVPKSFVEEFRKPFTADDWGDFEKDRVHRAELKGPGIELTFNRSGEEDWVVGEGEEFTTDSMRVRWYLGDLKDSKASKVMAYAAQDLAKWGLDMPQWRIRVKGLAVDKVFLISEMGAEGGRYATIEGSGRVVLLDSSQVSRLTKDKSYFRKGG